LKFLGSASAGWSQKREAGVWRWVLRRLSPGVPGEFSGIPGEFSGVPGNFRGSLGSFRGSLGSFRGSRGIFGDPWGVFGGPWGVFGGPGEFSGIPGEFSGVPGEFSGVPGEFSGVPGNFRRQINFSAGINCRLPVKIDFWIGFYVSWRRIFVPAGPVLAFFGPIARLRDLFWHFSAPSRARESNYFGGIRVEPLGLHQKPGVGGPVGFHSYDSFAAGIFCAPNSSARRRACAR
jgi:hypothetical protein